MTRKLNNHILNSSATLTGVCVTVISVVKLIEHQARMDYMLDQAMSCNALLFTLASVLSYLSIRHESQRLELSRRYENWADHLFMTGLLLMTACAVLFAFETF